ncbi:hypothetical protein ACFORJ_04120 [Corynebacterium hansenii]|uniref:DUF222 domain-containing protein n=1 Tax=Corynebacterium hansenii TaxID=394964 RepID=A0ABV7ZMF3_9CORY|nr:hypothetical protein [Corynebacterium hansenii]WJY98814.1 hypothetical protein CHAN_00885 [Corynebacterium hansenii]
MTSGGHDRLAARQAAVARALASSSEEAAGEALDGDPGPALDAGQVAWSRTQLRIKHAGAIARRAPMLAEAVAATGRSWAAEYVAWVEARAGENGGGAAGGDAAADGVGARAGANGGGAAGGDADLAEAAELSAHLCGRMRVPAAVVDEMLVLRDLVAGPSRVRVLRGCGRWMIRVGGRRRFGGRGCSNAAGR